MHYQRIVQHYYLLNGFNDVNFRHIYIACLPEQLQPELRRSITAIKRDFNTISIGEIHHLTLACLKKMCGQ